MNRASQAPSGASSNRGQALVVVAVMMASLLGMGALAVDLGYLYVTRNELQDVADGAALAGARMLGHIYQGLAEEAQVGFVCGSGCVNSIKATTQDVASHNVAGGVIMSVDTMNDVAIGHWDGDTFTPTLNRPDAVQVITRREPGTNGQVGTFFARTLGIFTASVNAVAVAALTGQGTSNPGEIELPIGISSFFFENPDYCHDDITFYPTNDPSSCAGWTSWTYGSNDQTLRDILEGDLTSPGTIAGSTIFNFTGGTLSNPTFRDLLILFQNEGCDIDPAPDGDCLPAGSGYNGHYCLDTSGVCANAHPLYDADGVRQLYPDGTPRNYHQWDTTVPVYDRSDCSNPNQSILIVGYAKVLMKDVLNSPDKLVRGQVECNYVSSEDNRGGGGAYGILGSIPGLVR